MATLQERPARIVNVSSKLHTLGRLDPSNPQDPGGFSAFKAYCRAKLAQVCPPSSTPHVRLGAACLSLIRVPACLARGPLPSQGLSCTP